MSLSMSGFSVNGFSYNPSISATAGATTTVSQTQNTAITSFNPFSLVQFGIAPYTYYVSSGTLPTGITINSSTGVVSGTPTVIQSAANVVFSVKDATNEVATTTSTVSFTVTAPPTYTINYLVVAGGGGGGGAGNPGGGGGGGGVRYSCVSVTAGTPYSITVGGGGLGAGCFAARHQEEQQSKETHRQYLELQPQEVELVALAQLVQAALEVQVVEVLALEQIIKEQETLEGIVLSKVTLVATEHLVSQPLGAEEVGQLVPAQMAQLARLAQEVQVILGHTLVSLTAVVVELREMFLAVIQRGQEVQVVVGLGGLFQLDQQALVAPELLELQVLAVVVVVGGIIQLMQAVAVVVQLF